MVVWIIGLSGAGKTTLSDKVVSELRERNENVVSIDGDIIREIFDNDLGYDLNDRYKNAQRISSLCKFLDDQGQHVVCAILSLFPESREWNRKNIKNYYEVFIDTPIENLMERDAKGLYAKYKQGEIQNVAGMDLEFIPPEKSELIISNKGSIEDLIQYSSVIINKILSE